MAAKFAVKVRRVAPGTFETVGGFIGNAVAPNQNLPTPIR
jgi:hypothetical protein